jgi:acetate---CoA ligase (ADP-forming)
MNAKMDSISKLFQPRSVAVIGASGDPRKTTGRPITYLMKHGYAGKVYPVNPKADRIGDLPCYASIADLPEAPDVAIVLLGAARAHEAVRELAARGTAAAIVLASGFGETGEEGAARQSALLSATGQMRILGPNTIGLVNLTDRIILSASAALEMDRLEAGSVGLVSQSGGILGSILSRGAARGIGFSKLISTSNEVDLELSDFIEYLAHDPATQVIALYVETIRQPERFRRAVQVARTAGKAVVAYKVGRSEAGARAAISHTGAMAGSDRMYDAFFKQIGVIRAEQFNDLLDICSALTTTRILKGQRIAVLTSTGGAGTLVADSLGVVGFETPPPDIVTAKILRDLQKGDEAALDRNPIDVTLAGLDPVLLRGIIRAVLASPLYDALVVVVGSSSLAMPDLVADAIRDCLSDSDKPILTYVSPHAPNVVKVLEGRGIPAFLNPESCAVAFKAMEIVSRSLPTFTTLLKTQDPPILKSREGALNEFEASQLFGHYGIHCAQTQVVHSAQEAVAAAQKLAGPVVLKVLSSEILHKSEVGGVRLGLTVESLPSAFEQMVKDVRTHTGLEAKSFIIQPMLRAPAELIVGMHKDPLGTALMVGMGGMTAELMNDSVLCLMPPGKVISEEQALGLIKQLKSWPLLDGYRGKPKLDVGAVVQAMIRFSTMVASLGDRLLEAEMNPLLVMEAGQSAIAADAVVILESQAIT